MTRRGPLPGTTGRPKAEIARIAIDAYDRGERMAEVVAAHYGISERAASVAIGRARKAGHAIPSDRGWTDHGPPGIGANPERYAHGTLARYRKGCKCQSCRGANAWAARLYRHGLPPRRQPPAPARTVTPRSARPFVPPRPTGVAATCADCGHEAPTAWELAAHTLDQHGRPLVATERARRAA